MTNDNKPPMFGPSTVIDQATYEPRSGKSAMMNELMAELAFERMTREVEVAIRDADDPNAKFYTNEEVIQAMQERIDRARDKPC